MDNNQNNPQATEEQVYNYVANQLLNSGKSEDAIKQDLVDQGFHPNDAETIIHNCNNHINNLKKDAAKKDMLYGALWCVGGTVATLANIGFIFWGAIVFGGVQLVKGLINYSK